MDFFQHNVFSASWFLEEYENSERIMYIYQVEE